MFLYCLKRFGDKYGVRGTRFGETVGCFINHPKNIGIHQESLISDFGIIQTPKIPYNIVKKLRKTTNHLTCLPYFKPY